MELYSRLNELEQLTSESFEDFLNNLKQEEMDFYDNLVRQYYELLSKEDEYRPKDDSPEEYQKWREYRDRLKQISNDYDVSDFAEDIKRYGEDKYKTRLNNRISEHIDKLHKSIKKEIGKVVSISQTDNNTYHLEGNNGSCNMIMSPIKISDNGNIVKPRIKILDVTKRDVPLDYVPEKEDNEWIKQWKEDELKQSLAAFDKFYNRYEELRQESSDTLNKLNNYYNYGIKYDSEEYKEIVQLHKNAYDKLSEYASFYRYYYNIYEKSSRGTNRSKIEEMFRKDINEHFKVLQAKVEHKIGEIVKIFPLSNNGGDYHFEGTTGDCDVEVILAGGYNIQRLHTRWIIRNVKAK